MVMQKKIIREIMAIVLAAVLIAPTVAWGQEDMDKPEPMEIVVDLGLARPFGFLVLAAGTTIFIVSYPFAAVTGSAKSTANALVAEPYQFTFERDLGEY
jgi:hypothetical protein